MALKIQPTPTLMDEAAELITKVIRRNNRSKKKTSISKLSLSRTELENILKDANI